MLARAKAAFQKMNRQNSSVGDSSYDGLGLTREDLLAAHSLELLEMAVLAAQQKTGAGGAALALVQGTSMICRASAGGIAPPLGAPLTPDSGITGACVRTGELLYCDNAETDPRVDSSVCRDLGIGSILVLPILDEKTIIGVLEVLSEKAHAFNASHIQWLKDVTELVRTVCLRESAPTARITPAPPAGSDHPTNDKESKPVPANDSFQDGSGQCSSEKTEIEAIRAVLPQASETASWDDIRQKMVGLLEKER